MIVRVDLIRCSTDFVFIMFIYTDGVVMNTIKYIEKQEESCCLDDDIAQGSHSPKTTPHIDPL